MTASVLSRDIDLLGYHDAPWRAMISRGRGSAVAQSLHLDAIHHSLLALAKSHVHRDGVGARRAAAIPAVRVPAPTAYRLEACRGFVRLIGRTQGASKERGEPGLEEGEDHRQVRGDDGDKGFACAP